MRIINDLNLKKQAKELDIKIWQTPSFLFILMGLLAVVTMTATYFISKNYNNPSVLVIAETSVVITVLIIGTSIIRFVEQIVKLNKMKNEFVSIASHQLRTPLSAIKWETELFLSKYKKSLSQKQLSKVEDVASLTKKMIRLVNDLLNVARIDQDRMIIRKQRFNFVKMAQQELQDLLPSIRPRHIEVIFNPSKRLPMAFGDPEKVKLVIDNLISNAIKYTTSGGKIKITIFKKNNYLIFEVKDNGVGIPEEQLGQVFDKFFRSNNAVKYQTEGSGLGLYIAKNIVEQLGGHIWFKSIENVGSMFSFSLPVARKIKS